MKIENVYGLAFSPAHTTQKIVKAMIEGEEQAQYIDLMTGQPKIGFKASDLVVVGMPVFGGRVPQKALENLREAKGERTPAIALVVYGNRAYEDALLELTQALEIQGFKVVGAAAFVAQHSIVNSIAKGRPDEKDLELVIDFRNACLQKIHKVETSEHLQRLEVKGNQPYRIYNGSDVHPQVIGVCKGCGICVKGCPTHAISLEVPHQVEESLCINCMACVTNCPQHARGLDTSYVEGVTAYLRQHASERCVPEVFI